MSLIVLNIASKTGNRVIAREKGMIEIKRAIALIKKGIVLA